MGATGVGKSRAVNFLYKKSVAKSEKQWDPVTTALNTYTGIVGDKRVSITDSIGFLGLSRILATQDKKELSLPDDDSLLDMPEDHTAIGFVSGSERFRIGDSDLLNELLKEGDAIPYVFLIFTRAKDYGETEEDQRKEIESRLSNTESPCGHLFQTVLKRSGNRYMLLESVGSMPAGYHERKSQELIQIVQEIKNKTREGYCNAVHVMGKITRELKAGQRTTLNMEECLGALSLALKSLLKKVWEGIVNNKEMLIIAVLVIVVVIIIGYVYLATPVVNIASSALASLMEAAKVKITEVVSKIAALAYSKIVALLELAFNYFKQYCTIPNLIAAYEKVMSWLIPLLTKSYKILTFALKFVVPNDIQGPTASSFVLSLI